ncbi:MAG: nodulation protein NfeD [Candidatus Gygaella obscura]|nr:nodulation protein NfeD [Candidatus Gygaella obscura]
MIKKLIFSLFIGFFILSCSCFAQEPSQINLIRIDNYIIGPVVKDFIARAIDESIDNKASCLIIELDTPGGLLDSTRDIVKTILNSKIPIVVYVSPSGARAGSAGVFITLASHVAVMAPSTNMGSAHPLNIGIAPSVKKTEEDKSKSEKDILSEKVLNDTLAWVTTIAKLRKRNQRWAQDAVKKSISSTETQALRNKVIDFIASDFDELKQKLNNKKIILNEKTIILNTKDASIVEIPLTFQERILNSVTNPNIAYILMLLGVIGLIFEFSHPGIGFPGIAGAICILLSFYSFQALPIDYTGILLIVLSIILFIAEAFTPTFGLLTLGGIVALSFGSIMLIKSPFEFLRISVKIIIPFAVATGSIAVLLVFNAVKTYRKKITTGKEGLLNEKATAISNINKTGKVLCHGEIWNAYTLDKKPIKKNDAVKIIAVEGLKLKITKGA